MHARFRACVKNIRKRTCHVEGGYKGIMASLPVEIQFTIFMGATEAEEFPLLAGDSPPTEAQLKARAKANAAWHDPFFMSYTMILFRLGGLKPGDTTAAQPACDPPALAADRAVALRTSTPSGRE